MPGARLHEMAGDSSPFVQTIILTEEQVKEILGYLSPDSLKDLLTDQLRKRDLTKGIGPGKVRALLDDEREIFLRHSTKEQVTGMIIDELPKMEIETPEQNHLPKSFVPEWGGTVKIIGVNQGSPGWRDTYRDIPLRETMFHHIVHLVRNRHPDFAQSEELSGFVKKCEQLLYDKAKTKEYGDLQSLESRLRILEAAGLL